MNDLTFFTNEEGKTLSDRFKKIISNNTQFFDVLVGYFRDSGFYEIYEALENVEKIRILIGINVDEETLKIHNVARSSDGKEFYTLKETKLFTKKSIKEEMEKSEKIYRIYRKWKNRNKSVFKRKNSCKSLYYEKRFRKI